MAIDRVKTISSKMKIQEYARTYFQDVPDHLINIIKTPTLNLSKDLNGEFDYIHIFVSSETRLNQSIVKLKPYLSKRGCLWVSWPKANQLNTDLNLPKVIKVVYQNGLVESKVISIDSIWSAIKITRPIEGKVYKNSYGFIKLDDPGKREGLI